MAEIKQTLGNPKPKKGSVQFNALTMDGSEATSTIYINRQAAKELLGVNDLDKVKKIEIVVRVAESD